MIFRPVDRPPIQLREVERYVREIIRRQPHGKRAFHRRYLILEQLQSEFIAFIILLLFFSYYVSREYEQIWTYEYLFSRGWFVGISLVLGVIVTLIISVTPIVRWYCGVRDGVVSIAEIVSVKMTVQESTVVYTIMGDWRIMTQGRSVFQTSFKTYTRKRESWWMSLAPGDRILVLVHPTKPKVLAELGPVDAEPRVPLPAIPELAATRTNGEDAGKVP